jgi:hypothetical protein
MMNVDFICEKYFNGRVEAKHLREFEETTPRGNQITGYICEYPNKYLGSCLITHVNNEVNFQFIQSMPKIHFFNGEESISKDIDSLCYEKLDGTCLIVYPLKDKNGKTIEILAKTRNNPIADLEFRQLFSHVDSKPIREYYKKNDGILIFELYGILNEHEIPYYGVGIDIGLIAIYDEGKFNPNPPEADEYGFKKSDCVFVLFKNENGWHVKCTSEKFKTYLKNKTYDYPTLVDAINGIHDLLDGLNNEYMEYNGVRAIEGVVINTITAEGHPKWIKCKPRSVESAENGVAQSSIRKEVLKYFDEYGSRVGEIYLNDKNHHTNYLYRMLEEEYSLESIHESKDEIEDTFLEIWDSRQKPVSINTICDDLLCDYSDKGIDYCMKIFERKYPMKIKQKDAVYNELKEKMIKYGIDL